jgi:hypothetical protein
MTTAPTKLLRPSKSLREPSGLNDALALVQDDHMPTHALASYAASGLVTMCRGWQKPIRRVD